MPEKKGRILTSVELAKKDGLIRVRMHHLQSHCPVVGHKEKTDILRLIMKSITLFVLTRLNLNI